MQGLDSIDLNITISHDRTVCSFVLSADQPITNSMLVEIFKQHIKIFEEVDTDLQ